jgi:hypothetical protein
VAGSSAPGSRRAAVPRPARPTPATATTRQPRQRPTVAGIAAAGVGAAAASGVVAPSPPTPPRPRFRGRGEGGSTVVTDPPRPTTAPRVDAVSTRPPQPAASPAKPAKATPRTPLEQEPRQPREPNYRLADSIILRHVPRASERPGYGVDPARAKRSGAFRSRAEWKAFFVNPALRAIAHRRAHETEGGPKVRYRRLPERKGAR